MCSGSVPSVVSAPAGVTVHPFGSTPAEADATNVTADTRTIARILNLVMQHDLLRRPLGPCGAPGAKAEKIPDGRRIAEGQGLTPRRRIRGRLRGDAARTALEVEARRRSHARQPGELLRAHADASASGRQRD